MRKASNDWSISRQDPSAQTIAAGLAGQLEIARANVATTRAHQELAIEDFYVGNKKAVDRLSSRGNDIFEASMRDLCHHRAQIAKEYDASVREEKDAYAGLDCVTFANLSPDDADVILQREQLIQERLKRGDEKRYERLASDRRQIAEVSRLEWSAAQQHIGHEEDVYKQRVTGLREALTQCDTLSQRQMFYWEKVIDKALSVQELFDRIATNFHQQELKDKEADHMRDIENRKQQLDEYLERAKVRIEESQAVIHDGRDREKARNDHQLLMQRQKDDAAIQELEAYAKHKLRGKGRHYEAY